MKTSSIRSYSVIENERFGLVFAKTVSIISGTADGILGRGSVCCMQGRDFQCVYVTLGGTVYSVYTVVVGLYDQPDLKWEEQIRSFKVLLHVLFIFLRVHLRTNSDHK